MNSKEYKQQLLNKLSDSYKSSQECHLGYEGRKNVVFGEGNPDAKLMFLGEAPGRQEDEQGRPFVGRSGKLLNKILDIVGIDRQDVFITNIVKCRPPNNRKPLPHEIRKCKSKFLLNQIKIIRPKVICTLGAAAIEGLLEKPVSITKIRGNPLIWEGIKVIPTYHPAYILRNPNELKTLVSDIEKVAKIIQSE